LIDDKVQQTLTLFGSAIVNSYSLIDILRNSLKINPLEVV